MTIRWVELWLRVFPWSTARTGMPRCKVPEVHESAKCATTWATKSEPMQAVVCPPPYPDRTKHAEVYVDGSDESGSRATNLTLFLHAITMSRIMDASTKMGPWMLRGWVRASKSLKPVNSQCTGLNGQRVSEVPGPLDEITKRPDTCRSFLCQLRWGPIARSSPIVRAEKPISDIESNDRVDPLSRFTRFDSTDGPPERYGVPSAATRC